MFVLLDFRDLNPFTQGTKGRIGSEDDLGVMVFPYLNVRKERSEKRNEKGK